MANPTNSKTTKKSAIKEGGPIIIQQIQVGQVNRGNQTIQTWYNSLKAAESTLSPNRRQLLNTYTDISIDLHLKSVCDKRIRAVKTTPFEWVGLENETYIENFKSPWFNEMMGLIMNRIFWGCTLMEFSFKDGLINRVDLIPYQNVKPQKGLISKDGNSDDGFLYREQPYINYILEVGKPNELGLFANIAPYVLMKRQNLADFARYNEMFGIPLRWYEYDPHDSSARDTIKRAAEEMGSASYVIVPKGTTVNFVESVKQATAYAFDKFHETMNNEITIGVLGQLLTTGGEGGGSYELGKIHKAVEEGINLEDRLTVEYIVNYDLKKNILIPHGYPLDGISGYFQMTDGLSMDKKAEIYLKISERFPIDPKFLYDEFGIPEPTDEAIKLWRSYAQPSAPTTPPKSKALADDSRQGLGQKLSKLYSSSCKHRHQLSTLSLSYETDLSKVIEEVIQKIFSRDLDPTKLDPQLYDLINKELQSGLTLGFPEGSSIADKEMLAALARDIQVFSGFKTYQFLDLATKALVDETGALRGFSVFREEVLKLNTQYNIDFLRTEYNHAVGSARMASKWVRIVKDKETLPLLQYITAGDNRVRQSHKALDGVILPADHPFWDTYMPPNDWNCRCNVKQLADGEQTIIEQDKLPELKDEFKFNPGKQKVIFPKNHPYYDVDDSAKGAAANNFGI